MVDVHILLHRNTNSYALLTHGKVMLIKEAIKSTSSAQQAIR